MDAHEYHREMCCNDHHLHGCDAVTYAYLCWTCELLLAEALRTISHNLGVAGALCRAFWDGVRYEFAHDHHAPWIDGGWQPGCGRERVIALDTESGDWPTSHRGRGGV
jgi:hypothetical protein